MNERRRTQTVEGRLADEAQRLKLKADNLPFGKERRTDPQVSSSRNRCPPERVAIISRLEASQLDPAREAYMSGYYAYFTGDDGHITNRVTIIAANDEEAKEQAKRLVDGHAVELWQEARKIATFQPENE